jgi:dTDP-4-amino-4,6-dideoxygalactose transaminase
MIPLVSFDREPTSVQEEIRRAFSRVLDSGHWILGEEVERFEADWARACGTAHSVGVGNGFDALVLALRCLGVGPGDEVITTPMTALATVLAVSSVGAVPVLADIDPDSALLDTESIHRCVTPRTRALLPVHLYGNASFAAGWARLAEELGVVLVEDCAQSHLATVNGRRAGSFGAVSATSFYPTKNLGGLGDSGALATDDPDIAAMARSLRNYGQRDRYHHDLVGVNSRMDEVQAAILTVRLAVLEEQTTQRRSNALSLRRSIANPLIRLLTAPDDERSHVHHLFVVRCAARDRLQQHLADHGVSSLIHYPVPAHQQAPYREIRRDPSGLGASEVHARECLSLPVGPHLTSDELDQIASAVNSFR